MSESHNQPPQPIIDQIPEFNQAAAPVGAEENWNSPQYFGSVPTDEKPAVLLSYGDKNPRDSDAEARLLPIDPTQPKPLAEYPRPVPKVEIAQSQSPSEEPESYKRVTPERMRELRAEVQGDIGEAAMKGVQAGAPEQQPSVNPDADVARKVYSEIAQKAARVSQGTFDPVVLGRQMKDMVATLPESERASMGNLDKLVEEASGRYGSGAAEQISAMVAKRLKELS